MSTYFSIGEVSKLHSLSIQTLRYYDKIDLLKPAYIKQETNYRYYTIEQFVKIDLIKHFKAMGIDLDTIKKILNSEIDNYDMLSIMKKQKEDIILKINELISIKESISVLEDRINTYIEEDKKGIFVKEYPERYFMLYRCKISNIEELEYNLRNVILSLGKDYDVLNTEISYILDKDSVANGEIIYNGILVKARIDKELRGFEKFTLNKGRYLTFYYNDNYHNSFKYYQVILEYIKANNLKVEGDYIDNCVMLKLDNYGEEKCIEKIEVLIE